MKLVVFFYLVLPIIDFYFACVRKKISSVVQEMFVVGLISHKMCCVDRFVMSSIRMERFFCIVLGIIKKSVRTGGVNLIWITAFTMANCWVFSTCIGC